MTNKQGTEKMADAPQCDCAGWCDYVYQHEPYCAVKISERKAKPQGDTPEEVTFKELNELTKEIERVTYELACDKCRGLKGTKAQVAKDNLSEQFNNKLKSFIHKLQQEAREEGYKEGWRNGYDSPTSTSKEFVICAAIRMNDGYIIRGHRHNNCILTASQIPRYKDERAWGDNQGFITSKGRYVNRTEGCEIQKKAGIASVLPEKDAFLHGELYSEDLY